MILIAVTYLTVGSFGALGLAAAYLAAHIASLGLYVFVGYRIKKTNELGLVHI